MRLNEVIFTDAKPVEGYGSDGFRVAGQVVHGHLICGPSGVSSWNGWDDAAPLTALAKDVDVLFIGTGAEIAHAPETLRRALRDAGVAFEVMATAPACRTYNVLLSEGRRVALAALMVEPPLG